jgi:hypothetical protein
MCAAVSDWAPATPDLLLHHAWSPSHAAASSSGNNKTHNCSWSNYL